MRRLRHTEIQNRATDKDLMRDLLYGDNEFPIPQINEYSFKKTNEKRKAKKKGKK